MIVRNINSILITLASPKLTRGKFSEVGLPPAFWKFVVFDGQQNSKQRVKSPIALSRHVDAFQLVVKATGMTKKSVYLKIIPITTITF